MTEIKQAEGSGIITIIIIVNKIQKNRNRNEVPNVNETNYEKVIVGMYQLFVFQYLGRLQVASAWCPEQDRPRFPVERLENHYLPDLGRREEEKEKLKDKKQKRKRKEEEEVLQILG